MNDREDEVTRGVAKGIQRQKDSESSAMGAFALVFIAVAAIGLVAESKLNLPSPWTVIATFIIALLLAGAVSERRRKNALQG